MKRSTWQPVFGPVYPIQCSHTHTHTHTNTHTHTHTHKHTQHKPPHTHQHTNTYTHIHYQTYKSISREKQLPLPYSTILLQEHHTQIYTHNQTAHVNTHIYIHTAIVMNTLHPYTLTHTHTHTPP